MAKLILMFNDQMQTEFPFFNESITIGRKPDNTIRIDNLAVSARHAKIDRIDSDYILTDLQSTNGTFVNEKKIISHKLKDRDRIIIGKHVLLFLAAETAQVNKGVIDKTMILDTGKQRQLLARQETQADKVAKTVGILSCIGNSAIGEVKLTKKLTRLGKSDNSEVRLSGLFMGATAATVSKRPSGYTITFTGGRTKLKVNGQIVRESVPLKDLDTIELGSYRFQFFERKAESP